MDSKTEVKTETKPEVQTESTVSAPTVTTESKKTEYKTSIVPDNSYMEGVRSNQYFLSSMTVEVIHFFVFLVVMWFIFGSTWKKISKN